MFYFLTNSDVSIAGNRECEGNIQNFWVFFIILRFVIWSLSNNLTSILKFHFNYKMGKVILSFLSRRPHFTRMCSVWFSWHYRTCNGSFVLICHFLLLQMRIYFTHIHCSVHALVCWEYLALSWYPAQFEEINSFRLVKTMILQKENKWAADVYSNGWWKAKVF